MKPKTMTVNLILSTLLLVGPALGADKDQAPGELVVPGEGVIRIKAAAQGTYLGVALAEIPPLARAQLGLAEGVGVAVGHVAKGSPADKAGLKINDVITQLDDQLMVNAQQLRTLIRMKKPGDQVTLTYIRKGKTQKAKAKLAKGTMALPPQALMLQGRHWLPFNLPNGPCQNMFPQPGGRWQPFRFPGGLGMMRQFNLGPKDREQFKKQLDKLQGMDPDELRKLFQQGGGFPFPGNNQPFKFNFEFKQPEGKGNNRQSGNRQFNLNANINSSVTMSDNTGSYTLNINNGKKRFKAKNADGEEPFNGPVDTDNQRNALDRDLFRKLKQLEGKVGIRLNELLLNDGKGGWIPAHRFKFPGGRDLKKEFEELDQFWFDPPKDGGLDFFFDFFPLRDFDKDGDLDFRFEFPPRKNRPEKKDPKKRSDA